MVYDDVSLFYGSFYNPVRREDKEACDKAEAARFQGSRVCLRAVDYKGEFLYFPTHCWPSLCSQ